MTALVKLAQERVVPYARTRFNLIPNQRQELSTPRSRLLGAYTIRGCGVAKGHLEQRDAGWDPRT
eukprot:891816-Prorocentrum_lima.AAC.1